MRGHICLFQQICTALQVKHCSKSTPWQSSWCQVCEICVCVCVSTQLHRLKHQLLEEVYQASSAADLESRACGGLPHGPHLLTCQKQSTYEEQHDPNGTQEMTRELRESEDHVRSSTQATWPQQSGRTCPRDEDYPSDSGQGQGRLRQLSGEASTSSAVSPYGAGHLPAAWETVVCGCTAQANKDQQLVSEHLFQRADAPQHAMQLLHSDTDCPAAGQHLSDSRTSAQPECASGALPILRTLQVGSHPGAVSAASSDSLLRACPASPAGCNDAETGVEQGAGGPAQGWPRWFCQAGALPSEPPSSGSIAYLSDSDGDDELARLEAKYGISKAQLL